MNNSFLVIFKPLFSSMDNGSFYRHPFTWLYSSFAILNFIIPFFILYQIYDTGIFEAQTKIITTVMLLWLFIALACFIGFLLWWNGKSNHVFQSIEEKQFIVTPMYSHFIQTFGEWLGMWVGIVGFGFALITTIILGKQAHYFNMDFDLPMSNLLLNSGWVYIILMPIYGFMICLLFRFISEQMRALSIIADNTKINNPN